MHLQSVVGTRLAPTDISANCLSPSCGQSWYSHCIRSLAQFFQGKFWYNFWRTYWPGYEIPV